MKNRVVITGLGAITPLGNTVDLFWENIKKGKCGIKRITRFDTEDFQVKIAAQIDEFDHRIMDKKTGEWSFPICLWRFKYGCQTGRIRCVR